MQVLYQDPRFDECLLNLIEKKQKRLVILGANCLKCFTFSHLYEYINYLDQTLAVTVYGHRWPKSSIKWSRQIESNKKIQPTTLLIKPLLYSPYIYYYEDNLLLFLLTIYGRTSNCICHLMCIVYHLTPHFQPYLY